ncbi:MAG: hypothetical protein P8173_17815, partial [Gammaproteobacteria bacterium]
KELVADVNACCHGDNAKPAARYILAVEQSFYALCLENTILRYKRLGGYQELLEYLAPSQSEFSPVVVDRYALGDAILPIIFRLNRPGLIRVIHRVAGDMADVYVVDERGSLFNHRIAYYDYKALIEHLKTFLEAVITRQNKNMSSDDGDIAAIEIEFYEAVKDERGGRELIRMPADGEPANRHYFNVQVVSDASDNQPSRFAIHCDDAEFLGLQCGKAIFDAAAAHMLKQRGSGARYPIYITDIDLPRTVFGVEAGGRIPTIHFLSYKKRIEERLKQAVDKLSTTPGRNN